VRGDVRGDVARYLVSIVITDTPAIISVGTQEGDNKPVQV
jgi:hypothetical protein